MEKKLGRMRRGVIPTVIYSRYNSFCSRCHYNIRMNERIGYDGRAYHLDCMKSINDGSRRFKDPKFPSKGA